MKAIRANDKSSSPDALSVACVEWEMPEITDGQCLVEVHGSGVNPSDVKGLLGVMPNLVWPRTPGRDYAGVVVDGPAALVGKQVWGTGGDLGMSRDGAHAQYIAIEKSGISEKPDSLSLLEAGGLGVSWTCAYLGLIEGAQVREGEIVAVLGASGKVGEAAVQLAQKAGARVIGVERGRGDYLGWSKEPFDVIDLRQEDLRQGIFDRTGGHGADVIMNSVGSPYFEAACTALAKKGRQIIISTFENSVPIDLKLFYRGNHRLIGVSNMDNDHIDSARILNAIRSGFECGDYQPFPAREGRVFSLEDAGEAYRTALNESVRDRIYINPQA